MPFIGAASHRKDPHNSDGFTLVEILVVLCIAAILSGIAIPNFRSSMRREQLALNSSMISSWIESVRDQAIQEMEACMMTINTGSQKDASLSISSKSPGCSELGALDLDNEGANTSKMSISMASGSISSIIFSPRGTVKSSQEIEVSMNDYPATRCIKIIAPVGLVRNGIKRDQKCSYEKELKFS